MDTMYQAEATAWGGRQGKVTSPDGQIELQLATPKEMGGDGGEGTNPEQMFAATWAACFHGALKLVAKQRKIDTTDSAVTVAIGIGKGPDEKLTLTARIEAEIAGADQVTVRNLLEEAHQVCPYSSATRGNIPVELVVASS